MNFGRVIKFRVRKIEISYPEIYMTGTINSGEAATGDAGEIVIYNLKESTIKKNFVKGNVVQILAGYGNDIGEIYYGQIDETLTTQQNGDRLTTVKLTNFTDIWLNRQMTVVKTGGISSKELAIEAVKALNKGYDSGNQFVLEYTGKEIQYSKAVVTFGKRAYDILNRIAFDTGNKLILQRRRIIIGNLLNREFQKYPVVVLNSKTGLIGSPELVKNQKADLSSLDNAEQGFGIKVMGEDLLNTISDSTEALQDSLMEDMNTDLDAPEQFKIKSLLNYGITMESIIRVQSKFLNGDFKVLKYTNNLTEFTTEAHVTLL